jgi:hypothetical protein
MDITDIYIGASYDLVHLYIQLTLTQFCTLNNMQYFTYQTLVAYTGIDKVSS